MANKIFRSTLFVAVVVLLCSLGLILGMLYPYFEGITADQLADELRLAVTGTEQMGLPYLEQLEPEYFRITYIQSDGSVIYDSQVPAEVLGSHGDREEFLQAMQTGAGRSVRYSSTLTEKTIYVAQQLSNGNVLRISVSQASSGALVIGMFHTIVFILIVAIALSALLSRRMARRIVKPLNSLDLDHPLGNQVYPEISPLLHRIHQQHQQLEQQLQIRQEFSANVSHELKTPLQSIIGSAELLENGLVQPEDTPRFVGMIRSEATRLVALINDIIHLSALDEGAELPREPVDLLALAGEVVGQLQSAAEKKQVTLAVTGEGFTVTGVPHLLHELIYNLCDNAIQYNREGGRVCIHVENRRLSVSDTGIGIPVAHQSRIFERFYRVDKSHSRQSGGTGLGLSIVKHAATYHGAELSLSSIPDQGTTITVIF